jgi:hypothetical protein
MPISFQIAMREVCKFSAVFFLTELTASSACATERESSRNTHHPLHSQDTEAPGLLFRSTKRAPRGTVIVVAPAGRHARKTLGTHVLNALLVLAFRVLYSACKRYGIVGRDKRIGRHWVRASRQLLRHVEPDGGRRDPVGRPKRAGHLSVRVAEKLRPGLLSRRHAVILSPAEKRHGCVSARAVCASVAHQGRHGTRQGEITW